MYKTKQAVLPRGTGYCFYGWETADVRPVSREYEAVRDPRELYDILSEIWCADTCAPRMRQDWTPENKTLGQCSVTAFLAQDVFAVRAEVFTATTWRAAACST